MNHNKYWWICAQWDKAIIYENLREKAMREREIWNNMYMKYVYVIEDENEKWINV